MLAAESKRSPEALLDFSANINPLGPPPWFRQLLNRHLERLSHYPDPENVEFAEAAARAHGVRPENVVPANGASEIIYTLPRILGVSRAIFSAPTYGDYRHACAAAGLECESFGLDSADSFALDFERLADTIGIKGIASVVWLGQPNNPTGGMFDPKELAAICRKFPECYFVVDESFADFVEGYSTVAAFGLPNVITLKSLTKFYGIPGLRAGYSISSDSVASALRESIPTWSVNTLAQLFSVKALNDVEYARKTRDFVASERPRFASLLAKLPGVTVFEGQANFLLLRLERTTIAPQELKKKLLEAGMAVRSCEDFAGLGPHYFRIAVRTERENSELVRAIESIMAAGSGTLSRTSPPNRKKCARLMLQGTASNAGKSVLTAAFCRILLNEGLRVAPFKAQNMSLNSYVTADGGEMGRAQVVQAQACHIEPDVRMNPVLLKPSSETGSQVIVRGKPTGFMDAEKYHTDKTQLFREVSWCFNELSSEYDAVVLEGAGSPGEVNLKQYDIVNMRMAQYAKAPVLLVGDIDRGGVFAAFIGTMDVLEEWERLLVRGFLINKFRGEEKLLDSAIRYTEDYTGRPTLGVIPMIRNLGIPEEDSVSFKESKGNEMIDGKEGIITIGIVDLPHISNFTDFDPLRNEPDVLVRIIRDPDEIEKLDAIIIPGSKNVFTDLYYLQTSGLASRITNAALLDESVILGICGGFQILGTTIDDTENIESTAGSATGLGLLSVETNMVSEKVLAQVDARHIPSGMGLKGYEIHHGRTVSEGMVPWIEKSDGEIIGVSHPRYTTYGTYLHGLFDEDGYRRRFIDDLRIRKGVKPLNRVVYVHDIEPALDRLASIVREHVHMDRIFAMMDL